MNSTLVRLVPLVLAACAAGQPGATDGGTSGGEAAATGASSTTTTTGAEPTTAGVDSTAAVTGDETGSPFIIKPDGGGKNKECDQWVQDCPPGQKCMPYSADGDNAPESLKCVDVVPEPDGLHEPCEAFGPPASGEDSCDVGLVCWVVVDGVGVCWGLCTGSVGAPDCVDPAESCAMTDNAVVTLCLPNCNPLLQDCSYDDLCVPLPHKASGFMCVQDGGEEREVFAPCQHIDECQAGLHCTDPAAAVECDAQASGCCVPFCDTAQADGCPGQGQECLPWYAEGWVPPGFEDVGSCEVP